MVLVNCSCGCNTAAEEHKIIDCSVCKKSFNHSCVNLTTTEVRTIKTKKGLTWSCRNCNILSSDINELKEAILGLKKDIASLRKTDVDQSMFEQILADLNDRNNRKQNIILFNVTEIQSDNSTGRGGHDLQVAREVLGTLHAPVNLENIEVHRLGRYSPNAERHRPLRIKLHSEKDVHKIIKNAKRLRENMEHQHIRISLDKTRRQTEYFKTIKKEMDARIAGGNVDLKIKYLQGIPTIVSSSSLN